jgi:hypothetical protein
MIEPLEPMDQTSGKPGNAAQGTRPAAPQRLVSPTCPPQPTGGGGSPMKAGSRFNASCLNVSRITHHANVTSELHRSCTIPAPFFDFAFHYSLPLNHLQNRFPKMVQFLVDIGELSSPGTPKRRFWN